ncbi:hypothetical protein ACET3Z_005102 [Daucus carota]
MAICSDGIGIIPIVFPDHEVRKLIGKCVFELRLEDDTGFPKTLMELEIINSQSHWKFLKKILQKQVKDSGLKISDEQTPSTHKSTSKDKARKFLDEDNTPLVVFKNKKNSGGDRMHAFVPAIVADSLHRKIALGKIHSFSNFQVKEYRMDEKFRVVHNDTMLVLTNHTKIEQLMETDVVMEKNAFDYYDLADLKSLKNDNMLKDPKYAHLLAVECKMSKMQIFSVSDIKNFGKECMEIEVVCQLRIVLVHPIPTYYIHTCTSCNRQIEKKDEKFQCVMCNRNVPYPQKRFLVSTLCEDKTGKIEVLFSDRQVQTIIRKTVFEVEEEKEVNEQNLPNALKCMKNAECTVKLLIKEGNLNNLFNTYSAIDLYIGFTVEDDLVEEEPEWNPASSTSSQVNEISSSTYHLDGLSQMNFETPTSTNN